MFYGNDQNFVTFAGGKQSLALQINSLIAIGSSISCFILSSVICLILGCCCCFICIKHKNKSTCTVERAAENTQVADGSIPIYEDLLPVSMKTKETDSMLKENVAYTSTEIKWFSTSP